MIMTARREPFRVLRHVAALGSMGAVGATDSARSVLEIELSLRAARTSVCWKTSCT